MLSVLLQIFFPLRQVENLSSCLQLRKSPVSRKDPQVVLPASTMVASQCNGQEGALRPQIQLKRCRTTARIAAVVLNLICSAEQALRRRKICGLTLSLC